MTFDGLGSFLEFCFTSYPFPAALLIFIIAIAVYWFVKIKPKQDAERAKHAEDEQKRQAEFAQIAARSEENSRNTIIMYEKALDNSTRAIENNTAALNMLSLEMKHLQDNSKETTDSIEKIQEGQHKVNENVIKTLTLLESKEK